MPKKYECCICHREFEYGKFCPWCGHEQPGVILDGAYDEAPDGNEKQLRNRVFLFLICLLSGLAIAFLLVSPKPTYVGYLFSYAWVAVAAAGSIAIACLVMYAISFFVSEALLDMRYQKKGKAKRLFALIICPILLILLITFVSYY